jgi:uncharacterized RDD family membrane protein YckC
MRCPKCRYISFEAGDRCRNCGYDFSLAPAPSTEDDPLPLHDRNEAPLPPVDLSLAQVEGLHDPVPPEQDGGFDIERIAGRATPLDLPLFGTGTAEAPLVKPPAAPRPPLAVRRATPDVQRLRARYPVAEVARLDLDTPADLRPSAPAPEEATRGRIGLAQPVAAPAGRRVLAAVIDLLLLGSINLGVLYFTLKLCALPLSADSVAVLPAIPLIVFLLLLDAGYAIAFTAVVGQTIGKMATGLRVVHAADDDAGVEAPRLGFAILRTAAYAASILPIGLGFVPALLGRDRRALHDRLAETRVVRI